ncbi:MAG: DUF4928 family protein [Candidatus Hydrogenedentales bacterium]|jgi:hypothetical protein
MLMEQDQNADLIEALNEFANPHQPLGKGLLSVGLILTRKTRAMKPPFVRDDFLTKKRGQVKGLSGSKLKSILAEHGIYQTLSAEGGRTSRGSIENMEAYLSLLNRLHTKNLLNYAVIEKWWIGQVREFFASKPLRIKIDSSKSLCQIVRELIAEAFERQKQCVGTMIGGAVMQHLVGAKLSVALPDTKIEHHGFSVADQQSSRKGDFSLGDTVIHVTTAPNENLIQKCCTNLEESLRPIIITRESSVSSARTLATDAGIADRLDVLAIEQFVATNIYEWSKFEGHKRPVSVRELIDVYNDIVQRFESDPRLNISIG